MSKHTLGNVGRQVLSLGTGGLLKTKTIAGNRLLNIVSGSINPQGNNTPAPPTPTSPASRADAASLTPLFRKKKGTRIARGAGQGTVSKKNLGSGLFLG